MVIDKKPLVAHIAQTLLATGFERVAVVGSELLIQALPQVPDRIFFALEGRSPVDNLLRGAERLGLRPEDRFLQCAVDLPMLKAGALCDLIQWASPEADVTVPLVKEEVFRAHFPGGPYKALRFREGGFINASVSVMRVGFLQRHEPWLHRLARHRKSVLRSLVILLYTFRHHLFTTGVPMSVRFLTGRLSLTDLSQSAYRVLSDKVQIWTDALPELAYDVDNEQDYHYAKAWFQTSNHPATSDL